MTGTTTLTQRLMQVAVELEDEQFAERRKWEQMHEDLQQRLAAAEMQKTQAQLQAFRLEEQLHEANAARAALEAALHSAEDEVDRLTNEAGERSTRDAHLSRINELMRELVATRFHLAAAHAGGPAKDDGKDKAASTSASWILLEPGAARDTLLQRGADSLLKAVGALDLGATNAVLSPACILAPTTADADEGEQGQLPASTPKLDHVLGAALHEAFRAVAAAAGAGGTSGAPAEAACSIAEALLIRGAPVEWREPAGDECALHAACRSGSTAAVSLLLEHGARVNQADRRGRTPLHHAVAAGAAGVVRHLLHSGADAELRDTDGSTAEESLTAAALARAGAARGSGGDDDATVLAALRDPTVRLVSKAKAANALYRAGEYARATDAYLGALAIAAGAPEACNDHDLATLHFNCARAALKEGRHITALEQAGNALDIRAEYANAQMLQAECHMELAEFSEAASAYAALARLEPDNPAWSECQLKASDMADASLYELLGVAATAEPGELKKAYHQQCLKWHPDKHQASAESRRRANNIFKRVTSAYEVLGDEVRRAEYDLQQQLRKLRNGLSGAGSAAAAAAAAAHNAAATGSPHGAPAYAKEPPPRAYGSMADAYADMADVGLSGAAARAFYEAFAAEERPTYRHRWSSYSFDGADSEYSATAA